MLARHSRFQMLLLAGMMLLGTACAPTVAGPTDTPAVEPTEPAPEPVAGLEGIEWFLSSYGPAGQEATVLPNSTITIQFAEGELSGSAGCNGYFGGYETAGDSLTVGMLGSTEMWCEGLMDQESAYLASLGAVETVSLQGEELVLEGPAGRMIFAKAAPVADLPLVGPVWELETFITGDTAQSVLVNTRITAEFGEDGRVSGSAGCNSYGSSYELNDDKVSFGLFAVTLMACLEQDVMDQEAHFLELFQNADSLSVEGEQLTIRGADGDLIFRPAVHLSLEGVDWTLSGIAKGEAVVETWIDQEITARFENGRLEGSAGCNTYFADYQIEDGTLTLGPVGSTRMACDEDHNQRETEFLTALDQVAGYEIRLTALHLLDADGGIVMQLRGE